jgi:hypothetical protein
MPKGTSDDTVSFVDKKEDTKIQGLKTEPALREAHTKVTWCKTKTDKSGKKTRKVLWDDYKKIKIKNSSLYVSHSNSTERKDLSPIRPNVGRKVDRPGWAVSPPSKEHKALILNYLRSKIYKSDPQSIYDIQSLLVGVAYHTKWYYREQIPYVRVWKGWTAICRRMPLNLVILVLRQIAYVPSSMDTYTFHRLKVALSDSARANSPKSRSKVN